MLDTLSGEVKGKVDSESRLEGMVVVGEDSEVINSRIRGPVIIGAQVRIIDADIGPYVSLGDRVHVVNSRIENSVVMEDSSIRDLDRALRDSLIGRKVQIRRREPDAGTRLLLGDFCETELA
jgi:glucose-1-phosphate thymidylyltransferase